MNKNLLDKVSAEKLDALLDVERPLYFDPFGQTGLLTLAII